MEHKNSIIDVFEKQKKHQYLVASSTAKERKEKLKKLKLSKMV